MNSIRPAGSSTARTPRSGETRRSASCARPTTARPSATGSMAFRSFVGANAAGQPDDAERQAVRRRRQLRRREQRQRLRVLDAVLRHEQPVRRHRRYERAALLALDRRRCDLRERADPPGARPGTLRLQYQGRAERPGVRSLGRPLRCDRGGHPVPRLDGQRASLRRECSGLDREPPPRHRSRRQLRPEQQPDNAEQEHPHAPSGVARRGHDGQREQRKPVRRVGLRPGRRC